MRALNTAFLYASQARVFWKARTLFSKLGFRGHRQLFGLKGRIRENRIQTRASLSLSRLTLGQFFFATAIAGVMQWADSYLGDIYSSYGLTITNDIYGTLLGTVTGMGAVLIGLYYAATTAIGGAIYARVPNNIRDLLARDRAGNVYMRQLAFLTYLGVILLGLRATGLPPIKIAIPFFVITSGIAIMAFVILGARADSSIFLLDSFTPKRLFKLPWCWIQFVPIQDRELWKKSFSILPNPGIWVVSRHTLFPLPPLCFAPANPI